MNKLWILRPRDPDAGPWDPWFDKAFGFVIAAETESDARRIAAENSGDEGSDAWGDWALSTCEELSHQPCEGVVMQDFCSA